jgi:hypothetical protein
VVSASLCENWILGETEVQDLDDPRIVSARTDHEVFRLQIAMNQAKPVSGVETVQYLIQPHRDGLPHRESGSGSARRARSSPAAAP